MKNNKAVTLVALIITIIILLILAGVVIAMTVGDDGIINKSQQAVEKYDEATAREKVAVMLAEYVMERTSSTRTLEEYLNEQKVKGELDEVINNEDGTITVKVDDYELIIKEDDLSIANVNKARERYYIFYQGEQYEEITGGWAQVGYDTAPGIVKIEDNYIYLWGQGNICRPYVGCRKIIDFSNYSTIIITYSGGGNVGFAPVPGSSDSSFEYELPDSEDGKVRLPLKGAGKRNLIFTHCYGGRCIKFIWTIYLFG